MTNKKLLKSLTKFLGEDAASDMQQASSQPQNQPVDQETSPVPPMEPEKEKKPKAPAKPAESYDNIVTTLSANIADINRQTSNEDWKKYIAKLDLSAKTQLVQYNEAIGELARKLNTVYADFTKAYWNASNKENEKGNVKGKLMNQVNSDPSVTDDATNKLPPMGDKV